MRIKVVRQGYEDELKEADSIVDKLCVVDSIGIQRGRNYLDEHQWDKKILNLSLPFRVFPLPGAIVEVNDSSLGQRFKTKLIGFNLAVSAISESEGSKVNLRLTLEKSDTP